MNNDYIKLAERIVKECISKNSVPYTKADLASAKKSFESLKNTSNIEFIDGIIPYTIVGLLASDHFFFELRMACGGYNRVSPLKMWTDLSEDNLIQIAKGIARFAKSQPINEVLYRAVTRLGGKAHVAVQFKPNVARQIILRYGAKSVFDPCLGWGDRAVAAMSCGCQYFGVDPATDNHKQLKEMAKEFNFPVNSFCGGIEEYSPTIKYDLAFTSPPYFNTEKYRETSEDHISQSWFKYKTLDEWINGFFRILMEKMIQSSNTIALNIQPPSSCNDGEKVINYMHEFFKHNGYKHIETLKMSLKSPPGRNRENGGKYKFEPVFIFKNETISLYNH